MMLNDLVSTLELKLGENLIGVYLYGSLATEDFVEGKSDVDLLMLLKERVDQDLLTSLIDLHERFNLEHQRWQERIDVAYVERGALWTFQSEPYEVIVSDGENLLTLVDAQQYYLIDWFKLQERGTVLLGPKVSEVMPSIPVDDFKQTVHDYMQSYSQFAADARRRGEQAYAILTMCRSLYACKFAAHVSKKSGAVWAMREYPQWRELIQKALDWNRDEDMYNVLDERNHQATIKFVNFMLNEAQK